MDTDVLVNTVAQQGQMNRMVRGSFLLLPPGSAATANLELSMREPASELEITRKAIQVHGSLVFSVLNVWDRRCFCWLAGWCTS